MIRSFMLLMYLSIMLLCIAIISENVKADVTESKKIHNLTTMKYVVKIQCERGAGSGVIYNNKILTAFHVIKNQSECYVIDFKGKAYPVNKIYKYDADKDIILLGVGGKLPVKGIRLAKKELKPFDEVYTIGNALNFGYVLTKGFYNQKFDMDDNFDIMSLPVIFGNSGGGIFTIQDKEIRLVGLVHAMLNANGDFVEHLSLNINLKSIKEFLK